MKLFKLCAVGSVALLVVQACATAENGGVGPVDGGGGTSFGGFDSGTGATGGSAASGGTAATGGAPQGGSGGANTGGLAGGGAAGAPSGGTGGTGGGVTGGGTGGVTGGGTGGATGGGTGGVGGTGGAPPGWVCIASYYGDTDCDCGCGVVDIDCTSPNVGACDYCDNLGSCSVDDCPGSIDPTNNGVCSTGTGGAGGGGGTGGSGGVPGSWTCNPTYFGDATCDCGCGALDVDCPSASASDCDFCGNLGSCSTSTSCPGSINPTDNSTCIPIPPGWNCDPSFYGDSDCDCGCGILDVDCPSANVIDCEYCADTGSCSTSNCPGDIKPTENWTCI
jgi:hypothetical protein